MALQTSFQTQWGTSIQGILVKWTVTTPAAVDASTVVDGTTALNMEITLNLQNMLDLSTSSAIATGLYPILEFHLMFLNNDPATVVTLPYDAFVGLIQFSGVTINNPQWWCMKKGTQVTNSQTLQYGNDWIGTEDGALSGSDATNNDEYTCTEVAAWNDCPEKIIVAGGTQCAQIVVNY